MNNTHATDRDELTYGERLNRFEIAQETIGFMMAMRTDATAKRKKKPNRMPSKSLSGARNSIGSPTSKTTCASMTTRRFSGFWMNTVPS